MKYKSDTSYESPETEIVPLYTNGSICDFSNNGTERITRGSGPELTDDDFE
ncbi:MAG: hypothetical protein IJU63_01520 [Bacteroidales bacterium]|nr:hypothetical protein [Bacteroidales bacterium]